MTLYIISRFNTVISLVLNKKHHLSKKIDAALPPSLNQREPLNGVIEKAYNQAMNLTLDYLHNHKLTRYLAEVAFSLAVSFALTALFVYSLSPLFGHPNWIGTDSNITQVIGRMMVEGQTPYIDIYDHKGPYLFYFAYVSALTHPVHGFFIWQSLLNSLIAFTLLDLYIEAKMPIRRLIPFLLLAFSCLYLINEGVAVDYSFAPFSYLALYFFLLALLKQSKKLMIGAAFIDGLCLGIALFSRASNAMIECLVALGILLFALLNKQAKSLLFEIPAGLLGLAITLSLPLLIAYANGYLNEMLDWTFAKNFAYASSVDPATLEGKLVMPLVIAYGLICLAIILLERKKLLKASPTLFWFLISGTVLFTIYNLIFSEFYHYLSHAYPFYLTVWGTGFLLYPRKEPKRFPLSSLLSSSLIIAFLCTYLGVFVGVYRNETKQSWGYGSYEYGLRAKEYIASSELASPKVLALDCNAAIYLAIEVMPEYPAFAVQSWWGRNGVYDEEDELLDYIDDQVDFLFVSATSSFPNDERFQAIIDNDFHLIPSISMEGNYSVYERTADNLV